MLSRSLRYPIQVILLTASYFAVATIGLAFAIPPGNASAVWPTSGIALVAVLLLGNRVWPGVWLGALLANSTTDVPVDTEVVITFDAVDPIDAGSIRCSDSGQAGNVRLIDTSNGDAEVYGCSVVAGASGLEVHIRPVDPLPASAAVQVLVKLEIVYFQHGLVLPFIFHVSYEGGLPKYLPPVL